jgi:iron complex outermembrane receptor protein
MMQQQFRLNAIASLFAAGAATLAPLTAAAAEPAIATDVVVISGSRVEHASIDLSAAIDVVNAERIQDGQMRVNASEALVAVPGLVVQNRQNYAQDLQISSRGFGARSAFGVRGVRLISDGIPASMPDGQGQAATFNLDMAERIEVLRGPFSAIYGNHSGGVIQLFTKEGQGAPSVETRVAAGSDGTHKVDMNAQGKQGGIGYVLDASRFETDGYRSHSAATRDQAFAKITVAPSDTSKLTLVANGLRQADTQDPLGVKWATFQRDPRAGEIDPLTPSLTFAERYNTRKSIDHQQLGATFEQRFGEDRLHVTAYGGNRKVIQYQAFSKGFQAAPTHSGGVVDFDRDFYGMDANWLSVAQLAGGKLSTTFGVDYGRSSDARQGFENFIGNQLGVKGALRRNEQDIVSSLDPYLQAEWQGGPWLLSAGLRHSKMKVRVKDHFGADDSGSVSYSHTTPLLGALYKISPTLSVYASAAKGFEAPTLNELFYSASSTNGGFNFNLKPAQSTHVEAGAKALVGRATRINIAAFEVRTTDELVVDSANSASGRTAYKNASKTLRQGVELSLDSDWSHGFKTRLAVTGLRAVYDQAFGQGITHVAVGSHLPGVPSANLFAELSWKNASENFGAALETIATGKIYPEETNNTTLNPAAPGYAVFNARVNAKQELGSWRFKQFARINNLFDRAYVGSVIVGDSSGRFYEAAPGRTWMLGASAQYVF